MADYLHITQKALYKFFWAWSSWLLPLDRIWLLYPVQFPPDHRDFRQPIGQSEAVSEQVIYSSSHNVLWLCSFYGRRYQGTERVLRSTSRASMYNEFIMAPCLSLPQSNLGSARTTYSPHSTLNALFAITIKVSGRCFKQKIRYSNFGLLCRQSAVSKQTAGMKSGLCRYSYKLSPGFKIP